ncbi:hypothetical protein DUNSADRAFT_6719 [Dunaliella salina]|uniref:Uncharacterized protein n=1 Tax=Dunaliella salina TaxID=3046 RepID=A0ABQ7FTQ7_DUNSA|nr:hypothetical protein DUNSADRAFT_6719 [Dunaliella salina]|eukprot:KAF5825819.1 hypothetical protein DUNSADRAFT_6719 [Dunaliella salina]
MGIPTEILQGLREKQPGPDGARRVRRAQRARYEFRDSSGKERHARWLQSKLKLLLLQLFQAKINHHMPAEAVTTILSILSECALVLEEGRTNIPSSFKAMLSALEDFGVPPSYFWEYDMCPCNHIYRYDNPSNIHWRFAHTVYLCFQCKTWVMDPELMATYCL